jgi:hypothetical protein
MCENFWVKRECEFRKRKGGKDSAGSLYLTVCSGCVTKNRSKGYRAIPEMSDKASVDKESNQLPSLKFTCSLRSFWTWPMLQCLGSRTLQACSLARKGYGPTDKGYPDNMDSEPQAEYNYFIAYTECSGISAINNPELVRVSRNKLRAVIYTIDTLCFLQVVYRWLHRSETQE